MKSLLFLACAATLATTSGCFYGGRRGEYHEHREHRVEYREEPVYVRPPEPGVDIRIHAP